MAENADDIIDGLCCELCGQFFIESSIDTKSAMEADVYSHGYPATCWECWKGLTKKEKKIHQRALRPTI